MSRWGAGRLFRRLLLLLLAATLLWHGWIAVQLAWWRTHPPRETAFMAMRLDAMRAAGRTPQISYQWVDGDRISPQLKRAVLTAEDSRFVEHRGFDWDGIEHALRKNLARGKVVAGGSTISQQLAKNLFLSDRRSVLRKAEEAVITVMLEAIVPKPRILELYCNVVEWGDGIFGAEAAARHYYGRSAAQLNQVQAARLVVRLPDPRGTQRRGLSASQERRAASIAARMHLVRLP